MKNRSIFYRALGIYVFAALISPDTSRAMQINGIYDLQTPTRPIPPAVFGNQNVDGIALEFLWSELEPRDGEFDFSRLDGLISRSARKAKKVSLTVTPGVFSPEWIRSNPQIAQYSFQWDRPWAFRPCSMVQTPLPWDPVYLAKWEDFVRAMGRRYSGNSTVAMVKITGINAQTSEMMLPFATVKAAIPVSCPQARTETVNSWKRTGYTRRKIVTAWKSIADTFSQAFPNQKIVMEVVQFGLPPLDDEGNEMGGSKGDTLGVQRIIALGIESYGRQFVLQNDALSGFFYWRGIAQYSGQVSIGFQTLGKVTDDPRCRMNRFVSPCEPAQMLQATVDNGLKAGAAYFELYIPDIMNPQLQSIIAYAHRRLTIDKNP